MRHLTVEQLQDLTKIIRVAMYNNVESAEDVRAALCEQFDRLKEFDDAAVDFVFALRAVSIRKR